MTTNQTDYQCIGCGATIQTKNPNEPGYLPSSALQKGLEKGEFYCQRCFKLRHYNDIQDLDISDDVFLTKLSQISNDRGLIINVVDLFDLEGSMIQGLNRLIGQQPFVVYANKFDLLPKVTKKNRVRHWVEHTFYQNGLRPMEVLLGSATKKTPAKELVNLIEEHIQTKNIYIVGVTNVGKSTLINQLIHYYGGEREIITTSNVPGTTLDLIHIPLNEDYAIIDTPGIIHRHQIAHHLNRKEMKQVLPTKPSKPKTFQLNEGQTIFINGLARVDFVKGDQSSFTFYVSNEAYLHRTKLEKADEFYEKHVGGLLSPPSTDQKDSFPPLVSQSITLNPNQDIAISGLGWFTVNKKAQITLWVPKGVSFAIRDSII